MKTTHIDAKIQFYLKMEDEFLVLMHDDEEIDDEEFFILHETNRHRNLHGGLVR